MSHDPHGTTFQNAGSSSTNFYPVYIYPVDIVVQLKCATSQNVELLSRELVFREGKSTEHTG